MDVWMSAVGMKLIGLPEPRSNMEWMSFKGVDTNRARNRFHTLVG
jgi:hypothetical protein